jgi:hypothetical protein
MISYWPLASGYLRSADFQFLFITNRVNEILIVFKKSNANDKVPEASYQKPEAYEKSIG